MMKYSKDFKKVAVRLKLEGGMSNSKVAREQGVIVNFLCEDKNPLVGLLGVEFIGCGLFNLLEDRPSRLTI